MKHLFKTLLLVTAAALIMAPTAVESSFIKLDALTGDSHDAAHGGWFDVASFSWGASELVPAVQVGAGPGGGPSCALSHTIHFTRRGLPSAQLAQLCSGRATLPQLTIDTRGERHLLQNVSFSQCSSQKLDGANTLDSFSLNFTRCATHVGTPNAKFGDVKLQKVDVGPNAILIGLTPAPQPRAVLSLNFIGTTQAKLVLRQGTQVNGDGRAQTFSITLSNGMKWTFTDVHFSRFNGPSKAGTEALSLNFTKVEGPLTGFQDIAYKE